MRYRFAKDVDCTHAGRRVSVRYRDEDGRPTDVVGVLEGCDEAAFGVRDRRGRLVEVPRAAVIASRVVAAPARPSAGDDATGR